MEYQDEYPGGLWSPGPDSYDEAFSPTDSMIDEIASTLIPKNRIRDSLTKSLPILENPNCPRLPPEIISNIIEFGILECERRSKTYTSTVLGQDVDYEFDDDEIEELEAAQNGVRRGKHNWRFYEDWGAHYIYELGPPGSRVYGFVKNCSLVCKEWSGASRRLLYRQIRFETRKKINQFSSKQHNYGPGSSGSTPNFNRQLVRFLSLEFLTNGKAHTIPGILKKLLKGCENLEGLRFEPFGFVCADEEWNGVYDTILAMTPRLNKISMNIVGADSYGMGPPTRQFIQNLQFLTDLSISIDLLSLLRLSTFEKQFKRSKKSNPTSNQASASTSSAALAFSTLTPPTPSASTPLRRLRSLAIHGAVIDSSGQAAFIYLNNQISDSHDDEKKSEIRKILTIPGALKDLRVFVWNASAGDDWFNSLAEARAGFGKTGAGNSGGGISAKRSETALFNNLMSRGLLGLDSVESEEQKGKGKDKDDGDGDDESREGSKGSDDDSEEEEGLLGTNLVHLQLNMDLSQFQVSPLDILSRSTQTIECSLDLCRSPGRCYSPFDPIVNRPYKSRKEKNREKEEAIKALPSGIKRLEIWCKAWKKVEMERVVLEALKGKKVVPRKKGKRKDQMINGHTFFDYMGLLWPEAAAVFSNGVAAANASVEAEASTSSNRLDASTSNAIEGPSSSFTDPSTAAVPTPAIKSSFSSSSWVGLPDLEHLTLKINTEWSDSDYDSPSPSDSDSDSDDSDWSFNFSSDSDDSDDDDLLGIGSSKIRLGGVDRKYKGLRRICEERGVGFQVLEIVR